MMIVSIDSFFRFCLIVKDTWNSQIMNASRSLVKVDIGSKVQACWKKYVVENVREAINNTK